MAQIKNFILLILFIVIVLSIGLTIGVLTSHNIQSWYAGLNHPTFSPPNWIFAPVWSTLYILIAISGWLILIDRQLKGKVYTIYIFQLFLNFFWSIIFFTWHQISVALLEMSILWIFLAWNIKIFIKINKIAGYLLIPYILWISFAWILNLSYLLLN